MPTSLHAITDHHPPGSPRPRHFVGASIGAWRMAAAVFPDPVAAQRRLVREYVGQRYPDKPEVAHVSSTCCGMRGTACRYLRDALLASGSIPLVLDAVTDIAGAPPGRYWDGGLVDYHLHLPYQREPDLVLYPHFADHIVPGWLDKAMP